MIHKKRASSCLNCKHELSLTDNFCPNCGQENTTYKLSFMELMKELFDTIFNVNTRLMRSIFPFLLRPGRLVIDFLDGKRKYYIHPIRIYLFMSIVFFFTISLVGKFDGNALKEYQEKNIVSRYQITHAIEHADSVIENATRHELLDSTSAKQARATLDSITPAVLSERMVDARNQRGDKKAQLSMGFREYFFHWNILVYDWAQDPDMTPMILLDSMKVEDPNFLDEMVASQLLQYAKENDPKEVYQEIIDNIPIMMILMLPIFAFYLKLLYFRRKRLYVEHLIFSLYIHAHAYLMSAIAIIGFNKTDHWLFIVVPVLIEIIYSYKMFKNVYQQGWFKTWLKMIVLGALYLTTLITSLVLEMIVSLLTF